MDSCHHSLAHPQVASRLPPHVEVSCEYTE